jgi:hypothetical protein
MISIAHIARRVRWCNKREHTNSTWVPVKCEMIHEMKYTETERNEMKRNEIYQNETKRNETKWNVTKFTERKWNGTKQNEMYTKTGRKCNLAKRIYRNIRFFLYWNWKEEKNQAVFTNNHMNIDKKNHPQLLWQEQPFIWPMVIQIGLGTGMYVSTYSVLWWSVKSVTRTRTGNWRKCPEPEIFYCWYLL